MAIFFVLWKVILLMRNKFLLIICLLLVSSSVFAGRGYVGQNPIREVHILDASEKCGPANKGCLYLVFENAASGCNPASNSLSISLEEPQLEFIKSLALVSLTSKKKFKAYATVESCRDAALLKPNGAGVYD